MKLVFVDVETGGLDPAKHPIIQLAAVAVDESFEILEEFEQKIQFDPLQCDSEALTKNSYNAEQWDVEACDPHAFVDLFAFFLKRHADVRMISQRTGTSYKVAQLIGHNAATFDGPFIQNLYRSRNCFLPASYKVLCTMQRAMFHFLERPQLKQPADFKLGTLCSYFDVPLTDAHDAMNDVRATVALYAAMNREGQGKFHDATSPL